MSPGELAASAAGVCIGLLLVLAIGGRTPSADDATVAGPPPRWWTTMRRAQAGLAGSGRAAAERRRRVLCWLAAGIAVWVLSGWPVAAIATSVGGVALPWLLGTTRVVRERIEKLEALEGWCRRMADTLTGGGAIGLTQAIALSDRATVAPLAGPVADAVHLLARRLREGADSDLREAFREFADAIDDRSGDTVAAALLLALHQQSSGVAEVLRQLADGVARDVRARRDIEAARAESRQSIRLLLVIQAALLVLLALVPTFAAPYGTAVGQTVMVVLLSGSAGLLVWMRRLSLGRPAPRFFGAADAGVPG